MNSKEFVEYCCRAAGTAARLRSVDRVRLTPARLRQMAELWDKLRPGHSPLAQAVVAAHLVLANNPIEPARNVLAILPYERTPLVDLNPLLATLVASERLRFNVGPAQLHGMARDMLCVTTRDELETLILTWARQFGTPLFGLPAARPAKPLDVAG